MATANKDTWQEGNYVATDAQVNGLDNTNNNFWLTGVQMELGSVATPFESRSFQQELSMCQRYYYRIETGGEHGPAMFGYAVSTNQLTGLVIHPRKMRDIPTLTASAKETWEVDDGAARSARNVTVTISRQSDTIAQVVGTAGGTDLTLGRGGFLSQSSTGPGIIEFNAEL